MLKSPLLCPSHPLFLTLIWPWPWTTLLAPLQSNPKSSNLITTQHLSTLLLQPHWLFQLLELLISTCKGVEGVVSRETSRERDGDGQIVGKHHQHTPSCSLPDTPTTSTQVSSTPSRSPLSKYEAPRALFTETEPRRLGFPLSTSTHSTLTHNHSRAPTASTWAYPIQVRFPLPKYEDPCASFTETEPWRLGFPFHLHSLPLVRVPFACPHCLNLGLPRPS